MSHQPTRTAQGFAIIEVLLGIFILTMAALAATLLSLTLLRTSGTTRREMVAVNIARQTLESLRNVRDTNWQANSGSQRDADIAREHWNDGFKDAFGVATGASYVPILDRSACDAAVPPVPGSCALSRWELVKIDGSGTSDRTPASCTTLQGLSGPALSQLYEDNLTGELLTPCDEVVGSDPGQVSPTRFRRTLDIFYLEPDTGAVAPPASTTAKEVWAHATVSVYASTDATTWATATPIRVRLSTSLTDWFGRKEKAL